MSNFPPATGQPVASANTNADDLWKSMENAYKIRISNRPNSVYEESIQLIALIETRLAKKGRWWPEVLHKPIKVPLWLFFRGIENIAAESTRFVLTLVGMIYFGAIAIGYLPAGYRHISEMVWLIAICVTTFLLIFPAPSNYCTVGINGKHVGTVSWQFSQWEESSSKRIELIAKNVKLFEERARRRLTIFRWVLAAGWASVSPFAGELIKAVTSTPPRAIDIGPLLPSLQYLAVCFFLVESYARGVDIVFRSVELGCNETIGSLDRQERSTK